MMVRIPLLYLFGVITLCLACQPPSRPFPTHPDPDMVSSALSSRRGLLRRPKVCFTLPNPGRCEPPPPPPPILPPRTFGIDEEEIILDVSEDEVVHFQGCCDELPHGEAFDVAWLADAGEVEPDVPPTNCDEEGEASYHSPDEPGDYTVTGTATWSDGGQASDSFVAHVEED